MKKNMKYYKGYEGEPEIILASGEKDNYQLTFSIWNGYFETLLDYMIDIQEKNEGILIPYSLHEGWYDEEQWLVEDIELLNEQLERTHSNLKNTYKELSGIKRKLLGLVHELIGFLNQVIENNEKLYILYE